MEDFFALAKLVGLDPTDAAFWVGQYQNGNFVYIAASDLSAPQTGDLVLVSQQKGNAWPAPEDVRWGSEFNALGTVKVISDTHLILEIGNLLRSIKRPAERVLAVGDVVEIGDETGIGAMVTSVAEIEKARGDIDTLVFEPKMGSDDPVNFVGDDIVAAVYRYVELPLAKKEVFDAIGVKPASGVLFVGPPGTGKTMIARSIAQKTDASFFVVNGPEIVSKYVGDAELALRNIFQEAQSRTRSIIFFDEIDSIAPSRTSDTHESGIRLVGMLLTLMDGFTKSSNVMVIGATNRVNSIDKALRRGGRFQAEVHFPLPNTSTRLAILESIGNDLAVESTLGLESLALSSDGWSGSDLSDLWQQAGWNAAEDDRHHIAEEDLLIAYEQVSGQRAYRNANND